MTFTFCPACGRRLVFREIGDEGLVPYCESCTRPYLDMPQVCVLTILTCSTGEIALIRQSYVSPSYYVSVAGCVREGETPEECVCREVLEEIGLTVLQAHYLKSYCHSAQGQLMLGFACRVQKDAFRLSGEVEEARWFSPQGARRALKPGSIIAKLLDDTLLSTGLD